MNSKQIAPVVSWSLILSIFLAGVGEASGLISLLLLPVGYGDGDGNIGDNDGDDDGNDNGDGEVGDNDGNSDDYVTIVMIMAKQEED